MKKIFLLLFLNISYFCFSQNTIYFNNGKYGVIFDKTNKNIFTLGGEKKFKPTIQEINCFEKKINGKYFDYVRQYFGFYNQNNRMIGIILISKKSLKRNKEWRKKPIFVMGGGDDYINIVFKLSENKILSENKNTIE